MVSSNPAVPSGRESSPTGKGIDFTDPNSPLAPCYLRAGHLAAVVIVGLFTLLYTWVPLWHTDVWGHLAFGRWIVQNRRLPEREPLCPFADKQTPYVNYQWLSQVGFYLTYSLGEELAGGDAIRRSEGGVELLRDLHALLALLFAVLLLGAFWRRTDSLPLACAGLIVLVILAPALLVFLRPQLLGFVFFAALLRALSRPLLSRRALLLVPALMVVWANTHGSFTVGLLLVGLCLAGRIVEACVAAGSWNPARAWGDVQARRLLVVLAASATLIAALNPHGPWLYIHVLRLARHPNIATFLEWQPLQFSLAFGDHTGYLLSLALLLGTQVLSPRWLSPTQALVILVFGPWPLLQARMLGWWVVLVPWLLLPHWAAIGARIRGGWLHYQSVLSLRKTVAAVLLVGVLLPWSGPARWLTSGRPRPLQQSVSPGTPWRLAAELTAPPEDRGRWIGPLAQALKEYPDGRFTGRIFASETQGDYLLWALPSEYPVLVYTHIHLFAPQHWEECRAVKEGREDWRQILDRHGVNLIVVEPDRSPRLRELLHQDPEWVVLVDEAGSGAKRQTIDRVLIALRKPASHR